MVKKDAGIAENKKAIAIKDAEIAKLKNIKTAGKLCAIIFKESIRFIPQDIYEKKRYWMWQYLGNGSCLTRVY